MSELALSGVRVIDLTHYISGPYCTKLLAGLGAEVIKIERPIEGDGSRRLGPFPEDRPHLEKSGLFLYLNTGKKGITLNLKTKKGTDILKELVRKADILVESFSPKVMASLGLDYSALEKLNPSLVMTSISNFGQSGPYRDYKAGELGLQAAGGFAYVTGDSDREPLKIGGFELQYLSGMMALAPTLAALYLEEETGQGQHIDMSITEGAASASLLTLMHWYYKKEVRKRTGQRSGWYPHGIYPCKDGYVALTAAPLRRWPIFAKLMGQPELASPRFASNFSRLQYADEVDALMYPWLMERTKEELYHTGQAAKLAFGMLCNAEDLLKSPQLKARNFFVEVEHPRAGKITYPGAPVQMSNSPWRMGRAPLLGEHNEEVYRDLLGYTRKELVNLRRGGIV